MLTSNERQMTAQLNVTVSTGIDDAEATADTLAYLVKQDLEDEGWDVNAIHPIVQCRDCEWCQHLGEDDAVCVYWSCDTDDDGYCWQAERRTD